MPLGRYLILFYPALFFFNGAQKWKSLRLRHFNDLIAFRFGNLMRVYASYAYSRVMNSQHYFESIGETFVKDGLQN